MAVHVSSPVVRPFGDLFLFTFSAEHLAYEVDMFFGIVEALARSTTIGALSTAEAKRLKNVLIEGFAIHLRNLIDFLYLEKPHQTDVVAADFCAMGVWDIVKPPISNSLDVARVRANKEVAHLTSQRIAGTPPEKEWDPQALAAEIRSLLQLVIAKSEVTRMSPNVASAVR